MTAPAWVYYEKGGLARMAQAGDVLGLITKAGNSSIKGVVF